MGHQQLQPIKDVLQCFKYHDFLLFCCMHACISIHKFNMFRGKVFTLIIGLYADIFGQFLKMVLFTC